jgi:hypothetical protein
VDRVQSNLTLFVLGLSPEPAENKKQKQKNLFVFLDILQNDTRQTTELTRVTLGSMTHRIAQAAQGNQGNRGGIIVKYVLDTSAVKHLSSDATDV